MKKIVFVVGVLAIGIVVVLATTKLTPPQDSAPATTPTIIVENSPSPGKEVSYEFMATKSGTVALELVHQLAEIETKDFGTAGKFITGINGLTADEGHYWSFYVNDQYAQKGVSQTVLQEGDTIRFTYEEIDPTKL